MPGPHPGAILMQLIHDRGLKPSDFESAGFPEGVIRRLVNQLTDLSGGNAKHISKLSAVTGTRCTLWEQLQSNHSNRQRPHRVSAAFRAPTPCLTATGEYTRSRK